MVNYAVVEIAGKQYKVIPGEELLVDRLASDKGKATFDRVLLVVDGTDVKVGTPTVSGTNVVATIVGEEKGDKIIVAKFRAKSRYRRKRGFRSLLSRIKILTIGPSEKKVSSSPKPASKRNSKS